MTLSVSYGNGAVNFEGASFLPPKAIVFGNTIHYGPDADPSRDCNLGHHEAHHVLQYRRLGPLFIPIYVVVSIFTGYRDHPMEESAREHAAAQCP